MKQFFSAIFVVLGLLSGVAWWIQPRPVQEGKMLLVWCSDDNPARRQQIELFHRLYPQYHLRLDPLNNGMEKVIVQSVAGVGPDIFECWPYQVSAFVDAGIAWDITDRLKETGIDIQSEVWQANHPIITHRGRVYGFPRNASTDAVFYNKALFDENGIPYPKSPLSCEEFLDLARKLTMRDANGRIRHYGFVFWWQWENFINQWGGRVYSDDGTRCTVDSPEAIAAVQFMRDLAWEHRVTPTPAQEAGMASVGGWGSGAITWLGAGRAAMAGGGRWWLCLLRSKTDYPGLRLGVVEVQFGPVRRYAGAGGAVMINANSPRREQAFDFIRFMAGREYNDLINRQADGIAAVKRYCYTDEFLHDPAYPDEDANEVWRDVMERSVPLQASEFVSGTMTSRIMDVQLDLVRNNRKPPAEAMRTAARQVNEEIGKTLRASPALRTRYESLTGMKAE